MMMMMMMMYLKCGGPVPTKALDFSDFQRQELFAKKYPNATLEVGPKRGGEGTNFG